MGVYSNLLSIVAESVGEQSLASFPSSFSCMCFSAFESSSVLEALGLNAMGTRSPSIESMLGLTVMLAVLPISSNVCCGCCPLFSPALSSALQSTVSGSTCMRTISRKVAGADSPVWLDVLRSAFTAVSTEPGELPSAMRSERSEGM